MSRASRKRKPESQMREHSPQWASSCTSSARTARSNWAARVTRPPGPPAPEYSSAAWKRRAPNSASDSTIRPDHRRSRRVVRRAAGRMAGSFRLMKTEALAESHRPITERCGAERTLPGIVRPASQPMDAAPVTSTVARAVAWAIGSRTLAHKNLRSDNGHATQAPQSAALDRYRGRTRSALP